MLTADTAPAISTPAPRPPWIPALLAVVCLLATGATLDVETSHRGLAAAVFLVLLASALIFVGVAVERITRKSEDT